MQQEEYREIAIFGAGGLGREVACMIDRINSVSPTWTLIGFFDDNLPKETPVSHFGKILGGCKELQEWPKPLEVVICIGNPRILSAVVERFNNKNLSFPNVISPDFVAEDKETFSIGHGNIIKSNCKVTTDVTIGNFNILNGSITMGHDVSIGDCNVFMPGVRVSGESTIGNRNLFGSMSFVKQCLKVGNDITLSPLSPLLSKPKDGKTYIGNPARVFKF